jgi:hypothetical protein
MIYVGPAALPQAAPIAPESRRVVEVKLILSTAAGNGDSIAGNSLRGKLGADGD